MLSICIKRPVSCLGIEPRTSAWKAAMLPLTPTRRYGGAQAPDPCKRSRTTISDVRSVSCNWTMQGVWFFFSPGMESNHHFPTKPAGCPAVGRRRSNQAVSSRQMPRTPFPASGVEPLHLGLQPRVLPLDDEGKEMREKKRKVKNKWKKPAEFTVCAKTPSPLPESNRDFVLRRHAFLSNYTKRAGAPMQGVEP